MAKKKSQGVFISRKGMAIWIAIVVFFSAWMFVLGIMVGRGAAPVKLEVGKLEKELADLKAKMLRQEQDRLKAQSSGKGDEPPELKFYEALKSKKKIEPFKSLPQASIKPKPATDPKAEPSSPPPAPKPKPKPKPKLKPKLKPKPKSKAIAQKNVSKGRFTIQVAASKDAKSAEKLVATLRKKGYKAYQIRTQVAGKGVWYRVRVGEFRDQQMARKMLSKLRKDKHNGLVMAIK